MDINSNINKHTNKHAHTNPQGHLTLKHTHKETQIHRKKSCKYKHTHILKHKQTQIDIYTHRRIKINKHIDKCTNKTHSNTYKKDTKAPAFTFTEK